MGQKFLVQRRFPLVHKEDQEVDIGNRPLPDCVGRQGLLSPWQEGGIRIVGC